MGPPEVFTPEPDENELVDDQGRRWYYGGAEGGRNNDPPAPPPPPLPAMTREVPPSYAEFAPPSYDQASPNDNLHNNQKGGRPQGPPPYEQSFMHQMQQEMQQMRNTIAAQQSEIRRLSQKCSKCGSHP